MSWFAARPSLVPHPICLGLGLGARLGGRHSTILHPIVKIVRVMAYLTHTMVLIDRGLVQWTKLIRLGDLVPHELASLLIVYLLCLICGRFEFKRRLLTVNTAVVLLCLVYWYLVQVPFFRRLLAVLISGDAIGVELMAQAVEILGSKVGMKSYVCDHYLFLSGTKGVLSNPAIF